MKVYVVDYGNQYDGYDVRGIFASQEAAEKFCCEEWGDAKTNHIDGSKYWGHPGEGATICEWEVRE